MKSGIILLAAGCVTLAIGCKPKPTTTGSPGAGATPISRTAAPLPDRGFKAQVTLSDPPSKLRTGQKEVITVKVKNVSDVVWWQRGGEVNDRPDNKFYIAVGNRCQFAKAKVGAGGFGCEPASAASVAGARKLRQEGVIEPGERVVCILTGHQLKDPTATVAYHSTDQRTFDEVLGSRGVRRATFANRAVQVPNDLDEIIKAIEVYS